MKQIDLEPNEWSVVRRKDAPAAKAHEPIVAPGGWGVLSFWFCVLAMMWFAAQIISPLVRTYFAAPFTSLVCSQVDCGSEAEGAAGRSPAP